jgi:DnaK suppressor protein
MQMDGDIGGQVRALLFAFQCIETLSLSNRSAGGSTMEAKDLEFFKEYLTQMIEDIQRQGEATIEEMSDNVEYYSDPADRASAESDRTFTLRLRDRDRKLIKKINEALDRIEDGTFGVCEDCDEEIGIPRLKARPVTTLCIECKSRREEEERLRGD